MTMAQLAVFRPPIPFVFPRRFLHFVENLRKQVAPDGAEILEEHLVLETGRRAAALAECSANQQSPFEGGAALRQGM
jgi:hypothetical protein